MGKEEEEKKRNIHKRGRRRRKSSTASFPHDLTSEILLRLPAKSIARFRCVSKLWSSITTEPYFISSFGTRFSPQPNLLLFFKRSRKMFVFSFPQHNPDSDLSNESSKLLYSYEMTHPEDCSFSPTESVHGLICFRKRSQPIIWNPLTRQFLTLPQPEKSWNNSIKLFLGYDPIEGKHKVLCMPCNKASNECRVLTLGTSSWRSINHNQKHRPVVDSCGRCINGVLYYKAILYGSNVGILMSFDVRSEKFEMIELPPSGNIWSRLIPYQGRLGCLLPNKKFFVLEDANAWSCKHTIEPYIYDHSLRLCGISHAGEFIYVPHSIGTSFCISYFDPKRNTLRKVEFNGIPRYPFRDNQGLLHTFPNHIENPISL